MLVASNIFIPVMPYLLSFAAGAMMYVVVEELIPEMSEGGTFKYRSYIICLRIYSDDGTGCGAKLKTIRGCEISP